MGESGIQKWMLIVAKMAAQFKEKVQRVISKGQAELGTSVTDSGACIQLRPPGWQSEAAFHFARPEAAGGRGVVDNVEVE